MVAFVAVGNKTTFSWPLGSFGSFHQGHSPVKTSKFLAFLPERSNLHNLIKTLVHHKLFSKISFLSQLVLRTYSKKKSVVKSAYSIELKSVNSMLATLPECTLP